MKRGAAIYIGENRIVVQSHDQLVSGGSTSGSHVRRLSHSASAREILIALLETLAECKAGVSIPKDSKATIQPLLAATGEKTWNAVTRSFAYVGVGEENQRMIFFSGFPEKGSFLFRSEAHWSCDAANHTDMAAAFRAAAAEAIEAQNLANPPALQ